MTESPAPGDPTPPFRFSRESRIRIDRDGYVWHEGQKIAHDKLARALASWIAIDPASDRYVLRNALDWCFITVDDAPLVVRSCVRARDGAGFEIELSDGSVERLDPATLRIDADDVPYCDVRNGTIPARFSRSAAFALLADAAVEPPSTESVRDCVLRFGGRDFTIRRVARGEGAPKREPAHPDEPIP